MSKWDEKLCLRIAEITRGRTLPERSKARICAAVREAGKWRGPGRLWLQPKDDDELNTKAGKQEGPGRK